VLGSAYPAALCLEQMLLPADPFEIRIERLALLPDIDTDQSQPQLRRE